MYIFTVNFTVMGGAPIAPPLNIRHSNNTSEILYRVEERSGRGQNLTSDRKYFNVRII